MYITLQQRKGWANNYAKRRSTVPDPMITLKRLTPTTTLPVSSTLNLAVTPRGNSSSTSLLITPEKSDNREPSIATKLENAFWQSYPYLQQLYSNFVQHLNSSCQKKLREKVADMVVSAWNICEGIKKEHPDLLEREFESLLSSQMDAYRNSSTTEVEAYLGELISFHFEKTLHIQFQMYSLSPGVLSTAIKLTNQHQATILGTNLNFFLTYAQKKLNEVQVICQQKVKFEKKNLLLKNSKLTKLLFEPSILISDIDSLYHELDEVFCQYIAPTSEKKSIEQPATIRDLYQIHCLPTPSIGQPDSSPTTPLEEKLSLIFRTRLCSLHIVPINQLVTFTWLSVHKLCGTLCRFITQLIHSLNKLILYQITSVNGQVSHLMDLSHSIPIMIQNITKFLSIVQEWCFTSTTATTSLLSQESIGRVKIEFNKLYLEIQPSLLYYTFYLQSNSTSSDHCNDTTSVLPSHVILGAYQFHLITIRTINRLLFTTIKSNQNLFVLFETFPIEQSLFSLLKEFFLQFYFSENLKNLLCSDDWYSMKNSEQLLINLKQNNLSNEFIYLFEQLIQRYHEKYMSE